MDGADSNLDAGGGDDDTSIGGDEKGPAVIPAAADKDAIAASVVANGLKDEGICHNEQPRQLFINEGRESNNSSDGNGDVLLLPKLEKLNNKMIAVLQVANWNPGSNQE